MPGVVGSHHASTIQVGISGIHADGKGVSESVQERGMMGTGAPQGSSSFHATFIPIRLSFTGAIFVRFILHFGAKAQSREWCRLLF